MKTTVQGVLIRLTDDRRDAIEDLIRRFESATRYAYARICDETPILDVEKDVVGKFSINARWAKDAVSRAKAVHIRAEQLVKKGKLESPRKIVWGGRKNLKRRSAGEITNGEWRKLRNRQFWSRGERSEKGNLNLRIETSEDGYILRVNVGHHRWVRCRLWIPEKFRPLVDAHLVGEPCYAVRVKRGDDDRYRVHVTFDYPAPRVVADFTTGAIGVDLNPSGQAWAETNAQGQLVGKGWIGTPELQYARRGRRNWVIGQVAKQLVDLALSKGKGIVLEKLDFKRGKSYGRKINRIFHQFTYRRLLRAIMRRAERFGVTAKQVNPAFTSVIGKKKYQKVYPHLVTHEAAAYVIARRGQRFMDMPVGQQRARAEEALEARRRKGKLHHWVYWRVLKRAANSGNGKPRRSMAEGEQGMAPTRSAGGNPALYRVKGTGGEPTETPSVQPGNPASR